MLPISSSVANSHDLFDLNSYWLSYKGLYLLIHFIVRLYTIFSSSFDMVRSSEIGQ